MIFLPEFRSSTVNYDEVMNMKQGKRILPDGQSQAYMILSLIAVSGELPANQIKRLSGGGRYKEEKIKELKTKKLIYTYYRDKLRGYRLMSETKNMLLDDNKDRFKFFFTGNADTNILKSEITRRLRLQSIAETVVTMQNSGVSIYQDEKPDVFSPDIEFDALPFIITSPAFYNSREIKDLGSEFVKIKGARSVGVLLTEYEVFVVYNTGGSLMKWAYKSEARTKALIETILCRERFPHQYKPENIRGMMLGGDMEQLYYLLTSTGGVKRQYFRLDDNYSSFIYLTNDRNGELLLKLLCDRDKTNHLNYILGENLFGRDSGMLIENDAVDENNEPVLFAYDCDMPRITRFNSALNTYGRNGTIICFDFQAEVLRRFCCENVKFQTIDSKKFEGRFFP